MRALAADVFRPCSRREQDRAADPVNAQPYRHGYPFEVHTDQRSADIKSGVGFDLLQRDGVFERIVRDRGKRSARLWLRHNIHYLGVRPGVSLSDYRAVQVLAALRGKVNPTIRQRLIYSLKHRLGGLKA